MCKLVLICAQKMSSTFVPRYFVQDLGTRRMGQTSIGPENIAK